MIADEVYGHLAFAGKPFVPMGVFGSIVPVLTLGSFSKRWIVPGWRLGWFVTNDPSGTFREPKVLVPLTLYMFNPLFNIFIFFMLSIRSLILWYLNNHTSIRSSLVNLRRYLTDLTIDM